MTLTRLLFEPSLMRSPLRIVGWWERRRLAYNVIVGATGVVTLGYVNGLEVLLGHGLLVPRGGAGGAASLIAIAAYGVAANLCYTMGWMVETLVERWLGRPVYGLGPALFRHGLVFSVGLTALPAVLVTVANVAGWLFGR
jgi:hypothetical protein